MKEEIDIIKLIEAEQAVRREADAAHVRRLTHEVGGDVEAWCSTRLHAVRVAAMALLLLLPGAWLMILPQRVDNRQVVCNLRGEEQLVVNRACSSLGNCGDRQVIKILSQR